MSAERKSARFDSIAARLKGWTFRLTDRSSETVPVGELEVPTMFHGTFSFGQNRHLVHLYCRADASGITVDTIELQGFDVDELEHLGAPMMRDVLTLYAATVAGEPLPPGRRADAAADLHRRARRNAISDDRVALAATAYQRGGIKEAADELGVGERQAWRYVQRAIKDGIVEPRVRKAKR